jgi:two-component system sensor histidine kinase VicK
MAIQAGDMGTFSINTKSLDLYTSPRVKELYGFSPDKDLTLEVIMAQIREDYRPNVAAMVEGAINLGERFEMEFPIITNDDGKERWFKAVGSTVVNSNNKDSYFTGTIIDITERHADDQRKNDFIGMVSHELKTPLTTLSAIVQLANAKLKTSPDNFLSEAMGKAQGQVKKMSKMINGFLNVSRLESGKISIEKEQFILDDLIEEIIQETELINKDQVIHFDNCSNVVVKADKEKIGSVISNLLSNGIKYSPGSKLLDVRCHVDNNKAIVSVKDYGMGVKSHDCEKLFDRYYRVESNINQHISGFGIGLYLSAEIIRRHDGEIWVESEYGQGSTFYFSLPL